MYSLDAEEALRVSSVFLSSLYSAEIYARWVELKRRLMFSSEKEFVTWMLDCIDSMQQEQQDIEQQSTSGYGDVDEGGVEEEQYYATDNLDESVDEDVLEDKDIIIACDIKQEPPSTQTVTTLTSSITTSASNSSHTDSIISTTPSTACSSVVGVGTWSGRSAQAHGSDPGAGPMVTGVRAQSATTERVALVVGSSPTCAHCGKPFACKYNLAHHVNTVHQRVRDVRCPHCHYTCSRNQLLSMHLVHKHGVASRHQCDQCGKYCYDASSLAKHSRSCSRSAPSH